MDRTLGTPAFWESDQKELSFSLLIAHTPYVQMTPWKRTATAAEKIGDQKLCFSSWFFLRVPPVCQSDTGWACSHLKPQPVYLVLQVTGLNINKHF